MTFQAAIVGLNKISASIGLALAAYPQSLTCVGYDEDPGVANTAEKRGAVTKSYLALPRCVSQSKVIILACPLDEVRQNLSIIADHAPQGAVVIDTSPNKTVVEAWAREILPEKIYFTGWTLAQNPEQLHSYGLGVDAARGDLFENSLIGVNLPPGAPGEVLDLSSNLVTMLNAKPYFVDSVEADGLIAMGYELPRAAALALLLATVDSPGWLEGRKLAGSDYAHGTLPVLSVGEREELGLSMRLNRDNTIRLINDLIDALQTVQGYLAAENDQGLSKAIEHAIEARMLWLAQRKRLSWDEIRQPDQSWRQPLLGRWLDSRLKKGKPGED